jgi:hypothetical protein
MNKIILATGSIVGYAYAMEFFIAWYSGNQYERYAFINRAFGPYAWAYWTMISCNVICPQLFWSKKLRTNIPLILRRVDLRQHRHVVRALRDHRHLAAPRLHPQRRGATSTRRSVDIATYMGSLGLFFTLFLLFIRWVPMIAMAELKSVLPEADAHHGHAHHDDHAEAPAAATAEAK